MPNPSPTLLRTMPAFSSLAEREMSRLVACASLVSFEKKAVVARQGQTLDHLFFLLSGFVKLTRGGALSCLSAGMDRRTRLRKEIALAILGPGDMVGELTDAAGARYAESAVALSNCQLLAVSRPEFLSLATGSPNLALYLMRYQAARLVEANHQAELLLSSTEGRIKGLLRHLRKIGLPAELYPSNAEIGRMIGVSRVMVSQVIQKQTRYPEAASFQEAAEAVPAAAFVDA